MFGTKIIECQHWNFLAVDGCQFGFTFTTGTGIPRLVFNTSLAIWEEYPTTGIGNHVLMNVKAMLFQTMKFRRILQSIIRIGQWFNAMIFQRRLTFTTLQRHLFDSCIQRSPALFPFHGNMLGTQHVNGLLGNILHGMNPRWFVKDWIATQVPCHAMPIDCLVATHGNS
jgi:hypothetical protein